MTILIGIVIEIILLILMVIVCKQTLKAIQGMHKAMKEMYSDLIKFINNNDKVITSDVIDLSNAARVYMKDFDEFRRWLVNNLYAMGLKGEINDYEYKD